MHFPRFYSVTAPAQRMSAASSSAGRKGFTLVELLVVIAIIVVLTSLAGPAFNSLTGGSQLTTSAQMISDQLALARQRALTRGRPVEVRFYRYGESNLGEDKTSAQSGHYRALQLFEAIPQGAGKSDKMVAIDKLVRLPPTIIMDSSNALSTLLNQSSQDPNNSNQSQNRGPISGESLKPEQPVAGIYKNAYEYFLFRFRPDGSTDLPTNDTSSSSSSGDKKWFLTVHERKKGDGLSTPPPNFATIQIDPVNGKLRSFRP